MGTTEACENTIRDPRPATEEELAAWSQASLQGYMDTYGVSFEEAVRRFVISDRAETFLEEFRESRGDLMDTYWLEHQPEFRAVIRVSEGTNIVDVCALVADSPITVAVQSNAGPTYQELERGFEILSNMFVADELPFWEVALDTRTNSIVVRGPEAPSAAYLAELSALAGVAVRFELMSEDEQPLLLPEPTTGSPRPAPY